MTETKEKQKSYKQKCHDIVGGIGGTILEFGDDLRLEAPKGFRVDPNVHDRVYDISKETGGKTGAWKAMYQDLRYYLKNGYYTCEAKQPGSLDQECDYCDAEELAND